MNTPYLSKLPRGLSGLTLSLVLASFVHAQSFTGLGDLPGGGIVSLAYGVSADGGTVVGISRSANGEEAFRWTSGSGMVGLGDLTGGSYFSEARGVSADGGTIVGFSSSASGTQAFRWTSGVGLVSIGNGFASAVSVDGNTVVGQGAGGAFRWTSSNGMENIGGSVAYGVSADGSTVVGRSGSHAFRWQNGTMTGLGDLAGGLFSSWAIGVSADGLTVVGSGDSSSGQEAFRWQNGTMTGLGDLAGGGFGSYANGASADGSTVVGLGTSASGQRATIWLGNGPALDLKDYATLNFGLGSALAGWTLTEATGISSDGLTIVGYGGNSLGQGGAWRLQLAAIPEPSTYAAIAGATILGFVIRRKRRASESNPA